MNLLLVLAPISVALGAFGLLAFRWTVKSGQYDDPLGDASRILDDHLRDGILRLLQRHHHQSRQHHARMDEERHECRWERGC